MRPTVALCASAGGAMIVALDGTVLVLAQPRIGRDLHASVPLVQWTGTGYLVAVAALLVVAGRLGDRYGHGRLLGSGALGFAAASAGIAVAPGIGWVIALRVAQGVFGALLQPATLALLRLAYPPDRLAAPVAIRTSAIGLAGAAGPVLGGALVAHLGWRAVFVLTVPAALAIAALAYAVRVPLPARRDRHTRRVSKSRWPAAPERSRHDLDLPGAALLAATLGVLVWALSVRWYPGLALAALAAGLLVRHERRAADPIVPIPVWRARAVTAALGLLATVAAGMFGALFAATWLVQDVLRLDPLATGLRVLPLTVLMVVGAPVAGLLLRHHPPRRVAVAGTLLSAAGIAGFVLLSRNWLVDGLVFGVLGAGFAAVMVTATGSVVGDAPPGYAGVVGGLKQTAINIGTAVGIAVAASTMSAVVLATIAAAGLVPALLLPGRVAGRRAERVST